MSRVNNIGMKVHWRKLNMTVYYSSTCIKQVNTPFPQTGITGFAQLISCPGFGRFIVDIRRVLNYLVLDFYTI